MAKLYKHKWTSTEGKILEDNQFSNGFLSWCEATKNLTDDQWRHGIEMLESEYKQALHDGKREDELWPPSELGFVTKCESFRHKKMYRSELPNFLIEDETAKKERKQAGVKNCDDILAML